LAPFWPRWTTTGIFRGGIDHWNFLRQISLIGIFQPGNDDIIGWKKLSILLRASPIHEASPPILDTYNYLRIFSGEGRQFRDLEGHNRVLSTELLSIIKPRWRSVAQSHLGFVIGVNIRRGKDFRDAKTEEDYITQGGLRTPLRWFVHAIKYVRSIIGRDAAALVISDGSEEDLAEILKEEPIRLLRPGCAASDLYALAHSQVLIGSGGSSFSAWGSYFAQCPTITIRGQSLRWFGLSHDPSVYVGNFHPDDPPPLFRDNLLRIRSDIEVSA
jgi:hypothetical protein